MSTSGSYRARITVQSKESKDTLHGRTVALVAMANTCMKESFHDSILTLDTRTITSLVRRSVSLFGVPEKAA